MTKYIRARNSAVLFKHETVAGVDAAPTAADYIPGEDVSISFDANTIQTNENTGSLDSSAPIIGGMRATVSFSVLMRGTGTAGTAPVYGRVLEVCGMRETANTDTPVAAVLATGGTTTTAALPTADFGTTANAWNGAPLFVDAGLTFVSNYAADGTATLVETLGTAVTTTNNVQIPAHVLYSPYSGDDIPTGTLHLYMDGTKYTLTECRGSWSVRIDAAGVGRISFEINGMFNGKTDAAVPNISFDAPTPPTWRAGKALVDRSAAACSSLSLTSGNEVVNPNDPNASEGFAGAIITSRNITGSIDPLDTLVATRDVMSAFRNGVAQVVHARFGSTAGNRVAVTIPAAKYTSLNPGDREGLVTAETGFSAVGIDSGAYICIY
ncbi:hypothetical protein [Caenispirillum bisanense]|uniref:Uncharacterized protein n=1 Tax=Caenispirillum bisanense TaxID=414052 RepID=A0A286GN88_9PROT|nr:hypothetical protein [Caenispirillum bisanense]SOD97021.1 hypothetical protein SAMN05421508_106211 [Caenispirillum bisanense]